MTKGKLFISHAAADKKLADQLVDLLQMGVDVPRGQIFCTSLEGMGVPKGTTFVDWIRQELVDATLVIALITPNYFDSVFCLCELGATWATQTGFYPLIVPPVTYEDLKAVLVGCQVGVSDDESDLDDMYERAKKAAATRPSTARWNQKKRTFITRVRRYSATATRPRPTVDEANRLREAVEALEAALAEATETMDDQAHVIEQLRQGGSASTGVVLSTSTKGQLAELERLSTEAADRLSVLPPIVREALYQKHIGYDLIVSGWNDPGKVHDAHDAHERGYLKGDPDEGTFAPDNDNQDAEDAANALSELDYYISELSTAAKKAYRAANRYSPDLSKRPFWEDNLGL